MNFCHFWPLQKFFCHFWPLQNFFFLFFGKSIIGPSLEKIPPTPKIWSQSPLM